MVWEVLNAIGTIAFAISGAVVAMEVKYDIIGIYILGLITAFGGGAVRNLFIGIPITELWDQTALFIMSIVTITILFILPNKIINHITKWNFFDAVGLSAFAVIGAMLAYSNDLTLPAIMFSAAITGAGGGIIRDVLAQKKPLVLRKDIYILWALVAGFIIGMNWADESYELYVLFGLILTFRIISHRLSWSLPSKSFDHSQEEN